MELDNDTRNKAVSAFHKAVNLIGSQSATARIAGCTPANIHQLLTKRSVVPARYAILIEAASGVSRHDLRPDIYPVEPRVAPAQLHRFHGTDLLAAMAAE